MTFKDQCLILASLIIALNFLICMAIFGIFNGISKGVNSDAKYAVSYFG